MKNGNTTEREQILKSIHDIVFEDRWEARMAGAYDVCKPIYDLLDQLGPKTRHDMWIATTHINAAVFNDDILKRWWNVFLFATKFRFSLWKLKHLGNK